LDLPSRRICSADCPCRRLMPSTFTSTRRSMIAASAFMSAFS
jgi:hypothetical protein